MVNYIWLGLILFGILTAAAQGDIDVVTKAALDGAATAVNTALSLIAIMAFWLGIMKVAEAAGFIEFLAKLVRPLIRLLFPSLPPKHPAVGAIMMNLSANFLGLGNAATPMGLLAMREMQTLNRQPDVASEAMCTFLALNTSCVTIPTTMIGIRAIYGSTEPAAIVGTTLFATTCGMAVAILVDRCLRHLYAVQER
ncbi:MAG TPA: spore maturation protein [Peptococcaceae bacterium]|nr:spore maturation protein [Peptococcaceae bacterium]